MDNFHISKILFLILNSSNEVASRKFDGSFAQIACALYVNVSNRVSFVCREFFKISEIILILAELK